MASSCGGGGETPDHGPLFRGEAKLLEGFAFDTGPQPSVGPASVTLRLSGGGAVRVEAHGAVAGGKLQGVDGSGVIRIDAHVKLDGTIRVAGPVPKSGDIPGLKDLDIPIEGSVAFDPFLLGQEGAEATAAIPETKLPDVPLGSVPGKLRLTIANGSQLVSRYVGSCMTVASGAAQYKGRATTSGKLVLQGVIALELPAPLNKEIAIPAISVTIPSAEADVEFASVPVSGAEDATLGACGETVGDAGSPNDTGTPATPDGGTPDSLPEETITPACSGEAHEPDSLRDDARLLPVIRDCDSDVATVTGVLSSSTDVDVLRFIGEDTIGCAVNPYAAITGPARICLSPVCTVGETNFHGCTKGTREGAECCGTEVEADFDCSGTTKDNARVFIKVEPSGVIPACSIYSIRYHY